MALPTGTRIGVYEVVAKVGEGGMGEVYRGRDTKLARDVALKVIPDAFAHDAERLARFEREARTLASLNHAHIAQVYGFEQSGGVNVLVMEFVDGEDLAARIRRGAIPLDDAIPIARQIAEALEAAHEAGIAISSPPTSRSKRTAPSKSWTSAWRRHSIRDPGAGNRDPVAPPIRRRLPRRR